MTEKTELPLPEDDGLAIEDIGPWGLEKYRLVGLYDRLFSSAMKNKWGKRVYIDLFSSCGIARVRTNKRLVYGSPILALMVPDPFSKYIFCDADSKNIAALKIRCQKRFPAADISYIEGDCNEQVKTILDLIPNDPSTLSLCVIDPYNLQAIKFETIKLMAQRRMDFFVLLMHMDASMNVGLYRDTSKSQTIAGLLGSESWREKWKLAEAKDATASNFTKFVLKEFAKRMCDIGYKPTPEMKAVRNSKGGLLYHLAIFSKHDQAYKFWNQVLKYGTDQTNLFEES